MPSNEVLFVLIPEYAEWEPALLAAGLRSGFGMWEGKFGVRTVAPDTAPAMSIGGFRTLPDYTIESAPDDFAALVLVGGMNWFGPDAPRVLPLVRKAVERNILLGAICDASMFLGVNGFLNNVDHTSNNLDLLKARAGAAYTGEARYHKDRQSVRDGNIVTANGVGFIEFAMNMFNAIGVAPPEKLAEFEHSVKSGFFPELF